MQKPSLILLMLFLLSCEKDQKLDENYLSRISVTQDGAAFTDGIENVPVELKLP